MTKQNKIILILSMLLGISVIANSFFIFGNKESKLNKELIKQNNKQIDSLNSLILGYEISMDNIRKKYDKLQSDLNNKQTSLNAEILNQSKTNIEYENKINYINIASIDSVISIYTDIIGKNSHFGN